MSEALPDPEYVLRGVAGAVFGQSYHLLSPTSVGRSPECDICLTDPGVSRMHAKLRPFDYGVEIEDVGSTNGSFLNGQRVRIGIARVGDEIAFDQIRFRVTDPRNPRRSARSNSSLHATDAHWRWLWIAAGLAVVGAVLSIRWLTVGAT